MPAWRAAAAALARRRARRGPPPASAAAAVAGDAPPPGAGLSPAVRRQVLTVAAIAFVDLLSYSLVFPLLPLFAMQFDATHTQTGMLIGSFALAQMLSAPALGRVSDARGRKPVLLLTTGGTIAGFVLMGAANSLPLLFAARILDGLTGGNTTAAQSYISDVTDARGRAQGFSWLAVAGALGFVCGPVIGGMLAQRSLQLPAFVAAAIAICNWLVIAFVLPESLKPEERARRAAANAAAAPPPSAAAQRRGPLGSVARLLAPATRNSRVALLLFLRVAWSIPYNAMFTTFSLFLALRFGLEAAETGRLLAYAGMLQISVQALAVGPITRAVKEDTLLLAALATGGASLLALALAPNVTVLAACLAPTALASALFQTVVSAALSKSAAPGETGALLGLAFSVEAATRVVAPVIAGALISRFGPPAPGITGACIVAIALPIAFAGTRMQAAEVARDAQAAADSKAALAAALLATDNTPPPTDATPAAAPVVADDE